MNHPLRFHFTLLGLLATLAVMANRAAADVSLPSIISDHMVLQREATVPFWGWAEPGEEVHVAIQASHEVPGITAGGEVGVTVTADAQGRWMARGLSQLSQRQPAVGDAVTVRITGKKNEIVVKDVLIGEVWLCSGQSNMGMTVSGAKDFDQERSAANHPQIRVFTVTSGPAEKPQEKCTGKWEVCTPETVGHFSATAYFFGRDLHAVLKVPVGLINSSVGGTPIEAWTSSEAQDAHPELKVIEDRWDKMQVDWKPAEVEARYQNEHEQWKKAVVVAKEQGKKVAE